jgi:pimeloyl-ACP methyl ester carboxylesterase
MTVPAQWTDRFWNSSDGIKLHYRDYPGPLEKPPLLCLPGLTRNARDFEGVANRFAGTWRVIAVDFRGRGGSAFDPDPANYHPRTYAADVLKLIDQLGIADAVFIGTSLGGLVTMMMGATDDDRIAGALLNDIGPEIDHAGIERIGTYVGKAVVFHDWSQASSALAVRNSDVFPDFMPADWERFARRVMIEKAEGIVFDYDMAIAQTFARPADAPPTDAWPLFDSLRGRPLTVLRGELSDLLSDEVAAQMVKRHDDCDLVIVPRVGHAPTLDEPESLEAIARLLARVEQRGA